MKLFKNISLLALIIAIFSCANAQDKNPVATAKFMVSGNCEMCKKTIETALETKGVKSADWNQKTKMIEIVYQPSKIAEDKLHELIAAVGYDTEKKKADDKAYQALPECCQYTRKK